MRALKPSENHLGIKKMVHFFYRGMKIEGLENLPEEPCIIVGNHSQMHGPIVAELYLPGENYIWCAGEMMSLKEVPAYAYKDFWSEKPKCIRWLYKIASYLIAPISVYVFNNADTIGVYRDARLRNTLRETMQRLDEGANVVIFPEHDIKHNNIIYEFEDSFIDIGRLYYKKTGRALCFVPLYIAPGLKTSYFGKAVRYNALEGAKEQRQKICRHLMDEISSIARALPEHTVVPYKNISKNMYMSSKDYEETMQ